MMSKSSRDLLLEQTTDAEVFQDMDNFELLNDSSAFALSLRLQFPKFSKGFSASDFEPFVENYIGESNLLSLGRLSFPNEWQMQVKNKDIRESLIRMGRTKINTRTCWISPLSQSEVRGFIHWIPTATPNAKLHEILRTYGEVLLMENQRQNKFTRKIECDSRYFGLYLKSGKTMDDLPHFINIDGFTGLITIRGRSPTCFHCRQIGHKKTECKTYREKLSDYCLRPAGGGLPRIKPRGKRFRKHRQALRVNQEVQTEITCSECIRERLAAEANATLASNAEANATLTSNAEANGTIASNAEANATLASNAEGTEHGAKDNSGADVALSLTVEDTVKPGFWRRVRAEKKKLKLAKQEELLAQFRERVKAICQGPVQEFANMNKSLSMIGNNRNVQESATTGNSSSIRQDPVQTSAESEHGTEVKETVPEGPVYEIEQLQKSIEEVLWVTRKTLEQQFETAKEILQIEKAETLPAGKKKRKRQKKKKAAAGVEPQAVNEIKIEDVC